MSDEPNDPPCERRELTQVRRGASVLAIVAAAALWALGLANGWFALQAPFELEVREGTVWLHVLAQDAGHSLYDPAQLAFLNMNHGPLDPLFKFWLHAALPFLPAQVITRAFVALLPFALLLLYGQALRRFWPAALWAAGTYVFLLGLGPVQFLIGRSDPTAVCFFCLLLIGAETVRRRGFGSTRSAMGWGAALGIIGVTVILLNWRYAPFVAAVAIGYGVELAAGRAEGTRGRLGAFGVGGLAGGALGFGLVIAVLFHGDLGLYGRHFFGVFTRASGWGVRGRMPFELFPRELTDGRTWVHAGLLLGLFAMWQAAARGCVNRVAVLTWFGLLALLWAGTMAGFFYNHGAGGLHYFAPFYVLAAYLIATRTEGAFTARNWPVLLAAVLLVAGLPWASTLRQARELAAVATRGRAFQQEVATLTHGRYIYSEDVHLFRARYAGEVIDVGDMVASVAASGFMGRDFQRAVQRRHDELERLPPTFVLVGSTDVISPELQHLVALRYRPVAQSGPLVPAQFGLRLTLYRLTPTEDASATAKTGAASGAAGQ